MVTGPWVKKVELTGCGPGNGATSGQSLGRRRCASVFTGGSGCGCGVTSSRESDTVRVAVSAPGGSGSSAELRAVKVNEPRLRA